LHYLGKLDKSVSGCTRNHLIKCFREWKGYQYVPHNVHKSICWTKKDPLNEGEIKEHKWKIVQKQKIPTEDQLIKQSGPTSHASNSLKQKLSKKDFKHNEGDIDGEPVNKKSCLGLDNRPQLHRNLVPLGIQWMQNSCAYDASFVILYSLYSRDEHKWTTHFQSFKNNALNNIQQKFQLLS
jgi:hypothetical protein